MGDVPSASVGHGRPQNTERASESRPSEAPQERCRRLIDVHVPCISQGHILLVKDARLMRQQQQCVHLITLPDDPAMLDPCHCGLLSVSEGTPASRVPSTAPPAAPAAAAAAVRGTPAAQSSMSVQLAECNVTLCAKR